MTSEAPHRGRSISAPNKACALDSALRAALYFGAALSELMRASGLYAPRRSKHAHRSQPHEVGSDRL